MIDPASGVEYNIFDLGFDKFLSKISTDLEAQNDLTAPSFLQSDFFETSGSNIGENSTPGNTIIFKERTYQAVVDINGAGDYTEIQPAIDYVTKSGTRGGSILILDGTYILNSALVIASSEVELVGESADVILMPNAGLSINAIYISGNVKNIKLKNFSIDGNVSNGGHTNGIVFYQVTHLSIEDVTIDNCYGSGILMSYTTDGWIEGCEITGCNSYGIAMGSTCSAISIYNNETSYCQTGIYSIETSTQCSTIIGNYSHHNTNGIYGGSGAYIAGNEVSFNNVGIETNGDSRIIGNLIYRNTTDGIDVIAYHVFISGNQIISNQGIGIYVAGARGCQITGNEIMGNYTGGIKLEDRSNISSIMNVISGNHFCRNSQGGSNTYDDIYLAGASGKESGFNTISNNTFYYTLSPIGGNVTPRYAINAISSSVDYLIITGNQVELSIFATGGIHNLGTHDVKTGNQEV